MDIRVLPGTEQPGELRRVAQRDENLGLLAEQIEIIVEGADLKCPGNNRTLVDCIGEHGRHKKRDDQNGDQDS